MNTIITQHNILNPHDRMVLPTYATHSSQILDELLIADGFEVTLYKNSELQLEPFDIKHGDIINVVFMPMGGGGGGKSILSLVAMIGLAVVAPQLGYQLGTMVMGGAPLTAFAASAFTAGVMIAGSLLINAVLSPSLPSSTLNMDNLSTSTTYSWDESYNKFQQGLPIPKVFGTHKITPPLISKYIETIDNKQYFNGLYAVNDGEITNLTDIKINDESIDNFENVTYEIRKGTLNQALIQNFDNVRSDKGINRKLSTDYVTTETDGNKVIALTATLVFPRGIFYANDSGGISEHSVKVVLEYSKDNTNWTRFGGDYEVPVMWYLNDGEGGIEQYDSYNGSYITSVSSIPSDAIRYTGDRLYEWYYAPSYTMPYTLISGAETSTIRKTFSLNNLSASQYYIRVKFYEEPTTGTRYGADCYFEYLTEEVGDDFIYPSTALISIRALATDQLSGSSPKISCVVTVDGSTNKVDSITELIHTFSTYASNVQIKIGEELDGTPIYSTLQAYKRFIALINSGAGGFNYNRMLLKAGQKYTISIQEYSDSTIYKNYTFTPQKTGYYSKIIPFEGTQYDGNTNVNYPTIHLDNFTPSLDTYTGYSGNDGEIKILLYGRSSSINNPSSICRKILLESGVQEDMILSSFDEFESECDKNGYTFNGVFDTSMTLRKALDLVSVAGRASIVQFGSKFEVIMDRAQTIPVQSFTFGMGNILKDSFSQSFLPILDRANVIEATYYDDDLDNEPTIVEVSNNNYDSVAEENRTAITLVGFTNRLQAIKHARYMLNCNRYLTETLSIEADKDSLVCRYGDVVRVSHDVPQYGFSGRIEACTLTTVTIDRDVTLESGKSYYIQLRDDENNVTEHYVNNSLSTTDTLTFTTPLSVAYSKYDNYAFGEVGKASKLFRVLRISTSSDMTRKLELLEYNEDVYNDRGDIDVPLISSLGVSNLRATDYIRYSKDGSIETVMQLAWSGASLSYTVSYKKSTDVKYTTIKQYDNKIDLIVDDVSYNIVVTDELGKSATLEYKVIGKSALPSQVTGLIITSSNGVIKLEWDKNQDIDFKQYMVRIDKQPYYTANNFISFGDRVPRAYTFDVYAIDSTNNFSIPTTQTFELKERSLTELIEDAYLIEKAFLDGKLTIYFTAPSTTPEDYDLLVANLNEMTLDDFSYASKQLEGFTFDDFASGLTYKYWYGGKWWICSKQQLLVIQRILSYVVTLDANTVGGDGNIRVFNKQPFVPYSVGDLWLDGDTIKVCQTEKLS